MNTFQNYDLLIDGFSFFGMSNFHKSHVKKTKTKALFNTEWCRSPVGLNAFSPPRTRSAAYVAVGNLLMLMLLSYVKWISLSLMLVVTTNCIVSNCVYKQLAG